MDTQRLKVIVEAALLAAARPLNIEQLEKLFPEGEAHPGRESIREALDLLRGECVGRGYELKHVASGYRFQVRQDLQPWIARLWEEKPPRYSRALLETLALIAYRQPITRAEIEEVRGVTVSTNIMRTMLDREWIRVLGHRDVPGKPAMYGTTREFLNYFNLKSLDELPSLAELASLDQVQPQLELDTVGDAVAVPVGSPDATDPDDVDDDDADADEDTPAHANIEDAQTVAADGAGDNDESARDAVPDAGSDDTQVLDTSQLSARETRH